MENHHFSWENSLFQWPFSIAMLVIPRPGILSKLLPVQRPFQAHPRLLPQKLDTSHLERLPIRRSGRSGQGGRQLSVRLQGGGKMRLAMRWGDGDWRFADLPGRNGNDFDTT